MERESSHNENVEEPQISSPDPEERILARRLRIQKRNAATKKRLQAIEDGKEMSSEDETILEKQVEKSTIELLTLTHEGKECISNVRVAADAHEVKRRCDQAAAKEARIKKLEEEANIARNKFDVINSKWEGICLLNDPLDLHKETEMQREKCVNLISQKDQLISDLKSELKIGDERFVKDQRKQGEDVALLVERIDSQIAIMRRAYRRELILIEQAIDIERKETMEVNNRKWEALYKQREEDEINNLQQRFVALSEHNHLMQSILVHHQEKFRATKISLEKDIQVLQQQLEQVKAICLLNKEKMEYNYQVLKKRDEESLLIRSQQKRRINKLQDIVTTLRRKILAMEQSTQAEVKRLTSEVIKLHRNIKDIQSKAEHFCSVNETKYFQLWKFNNDSAQKLLDKILSIDRLIYEQQLGVAWLPSPTVPIMKKDLPSYKAAVKDQSAYVQPGGTGLSKNTSELSGKRLLHQILQAVSDRSGFLVEDRLNILLAPYTRSQNTLVRIDNVFNALGVSRQEDMDLLKQTMEPYIVCVTCQPLLEAVHPFSPPPISPPDVLTEEELKARVMNKLKDTLEEGERAAQSINKKSLMKEWDGMEDIGQSGITTCKSQVGGESTLTPWVALSTIQIAEHSFLSVMPPSTSQAELKSAHQSEFTMMFSSRKHINQDYSIQSESSTPDTSVKVVETPDIGPEVQITETKSIHEPDHVQSINPVFVLKALREFVQKFQATKHNDKTNVWGKKETRKSISRGLLDNDVKTYWEQFRSAFPPEKQKMWDCLHMGLQKYHNMLQERHKTNTEIEQLKVQNSDLRRLLQKYALPNNMRATRGVRYNLPPISAKVPSAPVSTPAKLMLTFNNTSRL